MVDVLIRDVPEDAVAAIDAAASRLGLSRNEYLRRRLVGDAGASMSGRPTTVEDLEWFTETFADLADPEVMRQAWR